MLVEDFLPAPNSSLWARVVGGTIEKPCQTVASGDALHFSGVSEMQDCVYINLLNRINLNQ